MGSRFFFTRPSNHVDYMRELGTGYSNRLSFAQPTCIKTDARLRLDCEQSPFFFRFRKGVHARASVERRSRETRETRAAAREEKRALFFRASPVSRLQSRAWSFASLGRFARRTKKKERLLVV